jgi:hypothetical protein
MKYKISTAVILMIALFSATQKAYALLNMAKATIFVVDEYGEPIEGARAGIAFEKNKAVEPGVDITSVDGLTDAHGRFTAQHSNDSNVITYGSEKDGYYSSSGEYRFSDRGPIGWKPWNPELKVVMRKIENPVPMYAKKIEIEMPIVGKKVGFDLKKADWVIPYGQGTYSDLIFSLEKEIKSINDMKAKLTIEFDNAHDGIKIVKEDRKFGSDFKLSRFAPEVGYEKQLTLEVSRYPGQMFKESFERKDNYVFRVRSEEQDGKLKRAMYGKILGPLKFAPFRSKTALVEFKYYLNPDYTRNLEFDPKRNLFGNLSDLEQVREP